MQRTWKAICLAQSEKKSLLFLNEEGADNLLPDSLVAQDSTIGSVHSLLALGHAGLLLVSCRCDSLKSESSHGAFWDLGTLLEILEDQLASRSPPLLDSVGLGVVGQPTSVSDSLNHADGL